MILKTPKAVIPLNCHLYAGIGEPWAGQVKEKGRLAGRSNVKPLISAENLGEEPPTGSGIFIGNRQQKGWDGGALIWARRVTEMIYC